MAGNSWQQPVSGEPSWGTFHPHFKEFVLNTDPASTAVQTLDLSAEVPVGTKMVAVIVALRSSSDNSEAYVYNNSSGTQLWGYTSAPHNGQYAGGLEFAPVDSSRNVFWGVSTTTVNSLQWRMLGYWI